MTAPITTMVLSRRTFFFRQADRGFCGSQVIMQAGSVVSSVAAMVRSSVVWDRMMNAPEMLARFRKRCGEIAAHERNNHQCNKEFADDPDHGAIKRRFGHRVKPAVGGLVFPSLFHKFKFKVPLSKPRGVEAHAAH